MDDFYRLHPEVRRLNLDLTDESGHVLAALFHNARRVLAVRRVLREERPDVAVAMMTSANVVLALAARGRATRTIGSERVHPPQVPLGGAWEALRRYCYGRLDAVTALTEETAQWLRKNTGARYVPVVPNAVTLPMERSAPILEPGAVCRPGQRVLLGVGRLVEQKGFDLLISTFAGLAASHPDWDLIILGEGPFRRRLEDLVRNHGLAERVFLPGQAGNISEWYCFAKIYAMSSRFEGFPNTLAEAMAHGLPAVSFDCDTGPRDIIRDQIDGLLVPGGSEVAFAAALGRLMHDSALRHQFASRAVEARERFSMERIACMWEDVFGAKPL
jgi:glycosyltransferase involved in cell wall biosynthesis